MSRQSRTCTVAVLTVLVGTVLGAGPERPSSGEKGATVFVITKWNGSCSGGERIYWDDMLDAWYDEITSSSHGSRSWWKDAFHHDGIIVDSSFTDDDLVSWGRDDVDDNTDEADALAIGLHGGELSDGRWGGRVRYDATGDGDCNAEQGDISWGDYDLEFAFLSSCHSMDYAAWARWSTSMSGLHQIQGYHGCMWIGAVRVAEHEDFADDAFKIAISSAFMDNMHVLNINGNSKDQCPVVRGEGNTRANLWARMDTEQYDLVYEDDPSGPWHGVIYIQGCTPACDDALP